LDCIITIFIASRPITAVLLEKKFHRQHLSCSSHKSILPPEVTADPAFAPKAVLHLDEAALLMTDYLWLLSLPATLNTTSSYRCCQKICQTLLDQKYPTPVLCYQNEVPENEFKAPEPTLRILSTITQ
jgi:hypothetical protein